MDDQINRHGTNDDHTSGHMVRRSAPGDERRAAEIDLGAPEQGESVTELDEDTTGHRRMP